MGTHLPTREGWKERLVTRRTGRGQIYVLLSVEKRTCDNCGWGTEFATLWASPADDIERLTWCSSCFNARSEPAEPSSLDGVRRRQLLERARTAPLLLSWNGARAAIDDLERRGLL
ncbi:MAG: hypothetical protein HY320_15980 [Armatimonadetes bacterium]|nr:hypothetical protein [Armatimonadota bacterium]